MSHPHQPPATAAGVAPLLSYQPAQPQVDDGLCEQRWFTGYDSKRGCIYGQASRHNAGDAKTEVDVVRHSDADQASLCIRLYAASACSFTTSLDAESLRKLAFILLDAAHDIEQNPAPKLAQQAQEAA